MDLLVVRHAVAEEREAFAATGKDDSERPLTEAGRKKFERGARGLRRLVPAIDLIATSALTRAVGTAEILMGAYGLESAARLAELEPGASPDALVPWLLRHRRRSVVAVVGHEPHLSGLVELLLTGTCSGFIDLKKGGACLLGFDGDPAPGEATLRWLLGGSQLRRLRR